MRLILTLAGRRASVRRRAARKSKMRSSISRLAGTQATAPRFLSTCNNNILPDIQISLKATLVVKCRTPKSWLLVRAVISLEAVSFRLYADPINFRRALALKQVLLFVPLTRASTKVAALPRLTSIQLQESSSNRKYSFL